MKAIAINTAESILEPFWDPELGAIDRWTVNGNAETGTELAQGWCNVSFEWQNSKDQELVLAISKRYEPPVDVSRYDMLLLSAMVSNGCAIRIEAETTEACSPSGALHSGRKNRRLRYRWKKVRSSTAFGLKSTRQRAEREWDGSIG